MIKKNLYLRDLLSRDPFLKKSYEYFSSLNQDIYLVGGYIRDYLLGREVTDIDFVSEVDGNVMAKKLADYFSEPYYSLDEARGVGRVVLKKCKRTIDFSISKQPIENDLKNRDFSINALAVHLLPYSSDELRIIDVSCGLKDLEKKAIRVFDDESLKEDPIRILRAFRLSQELGFNIEEKTTGLIQGNKELLLNVSKERIRNEFLLLLKISEGWRGIKALLRTGVLEVVFPQLERIKGLEQNTYHHLDVLSHSIETLKCLEEIISKPEKYFTGNAGVILSYLDKQVEAGVKKRTLLKLASLFHDLGKADTLSRDENGNIHFYRHAGRSRAISEVILKKYRFGKKSIKVADKLIARHMRLGFLNELPEITEKAVRRFLRTCEDETVGVIILSVADRIAARGIRDEEKLKAFLKLANDLIVKKQEEIKVENIVISGR
ncbi:MAG: HD domain-containing protein, partial [Actinomycetia bacterium]|nr:HD domain-containing protein [Actinomycetes bacterium]